MYIKFSDIIRYYNLNPKVFSSTANYFEKIRWIKKYLLEVKGLTMKGLPIIL